MVLATVAVASVAVQAATIKWSTGAIKLPSSTTAMTGSNVNRYYFALSEAISGDVFANYATWNSTSSSYDFNSTGSAAGSVSKGVATFTDSTSYSSGDTAYAAVILWYDKDGDGKMNVGDSYIATQSSYTLDSDSNKTVALGMNSMSWTTIAAPTPPVPEPTSGILMLLGMAGLALRRKRA